MPLEKRDGRPTPAKVERPNVSVTRLDHSSVRPPLDGLAELDALAANVDGAFVVVVKVTGSTSTPAKYRRRCYLTAKSAENAARKATERGENATVYLAELKPLWRLEGGASR